MIWDRGASYELALFISNLIYCVKCDITVKDVTKINRFIVIGTTLYKFVKSNVKEVFLPCLSYHLTQTDVRIFSSQTYHHTHGGYSEVYDIRVRIYLTDYRIHITTYIVQKNLPTVYNSFVSEN